MVKLILALFLLAVAIKVAEPWTRCLVDQNFFSASDESKKGGTDIKEKLEQEQAFPESGSLVVDYLGRLVKHSHELRQFIPKHQDEPSYPPPNMIHS